MPAERIDSAATSGSDLNRVPLSREEQLEQAILRIYRTQVYEEPGNRDRGLNVEFIAAINEAAYLVETGETERHDFGMLGICVRCGADEREVNERIAAFKERKAKLELQPEDFEDLSGVASLREPSPEERRWHRFYGRKPK